MKFCLIVCGALYLGSREVFSRRYSDHCSITCQWVHWVLLWSITLWQNIISDFRHIVLRLEMLNFISFITEIFSVTKFILHTEAFDFGLEQNSPYPSNFYVEVINANMSNYQFQDILFVVILRNIFLTLFSPFGVIKCCLPFSQVPIQFTFLIPHSLMKLR